jgi:fused signal recognition particle receptor
MGFLSKIRQGLSRTREAFAGSLRKLIGRKIDAESIEELEEALILADVGVTAASQIVADLQKAYEQGIIKKGEDLVARLKADMSQQMLQDPVHLNMNPDGLTVVMMVGVNGTGKTTSIGKLAQYIQRQGKTVVLGAGDTFRAAAAEQLEIWSKRAGVQLVRHAHGSDPAAVAFDAAEAALARKADVLIVDTAGRLHTEKNLMQELSKIERVLGKKVPGAPHEVLLVLDATTGQNAISQAKLFAEHVKLTGIFLAKLDGTAKGGIVLAIRSQLKIPVKFIGTGETAEDIEVFDARRFVEALFEEEAGDED